METVEFSDCLIERADISNNDIENAEISFNERFAERAFGDGVRVSFRCEGPLLDEFIDFAVYFFILLFEILLDRVMAKVVPWRILLTRALLHKQLHLYLWLLP